MQYSFIAFTALYYALTQKTVTEPAFDIPYSEFKQSLNDGSQQMEEEVLANIHLSSNQKVILPIAVPIYHVCWTAWTDQDGSMNLRHDIYSRNTLLNSLFGS